MYNHQYLAISSCLLFITWTGARNFPSCEVYVDGNETHLYSQTIKFRRYYQMVFIPNQQMNVTFVLPNDPDKDGGDAYYYFKPPDTGWGNIALICNAATLQCQRSLNYSPAVDNNVQDSNNEIWVKTFAVSLYNRNVCTSDILISKESVAIEFELKWINENSLSIEITAGFPQPTEFSLSCDGSKMNVTLSNGLFNVNAEKLRLRSCQVTAKNYLSMRKSVDIPRFTFSTTLSTTNFPLTVQAQQGEPREDNSTVLALSITFGCVVLVLLAVIAVCWRRRRQLPDEQQELPSSDQHEDIESQHQKPPYMPSLESDSHVTTTLYPDSCNSVDGRRIRTSEPISMAVQEHDGAALALVETHSPSTEEQFEVESLASVEEEVKQVGKLDEHAE